MSPLETIFQVVEETTKNIILTTIQDLAETIKEDVQNG